MIKVRQKKEKIYTDKFGVLKNLKNDIEKEEIKRRKDNPSLLKLHKKSNLTRRVNKSLPSTKFFNKYNTVEIILLKENLK